MENNIESAKKWLIEEVSKNPYYLNFKINTSLTISEHVYCFEVSYQYQLNAFVKDVKKKLYVIFNTEMKKFISGEI